MAAILVKSLQILPCFSEITSVMDVTFCFHAVFLGKERTRVTIELPTPDFQPCTSSTEVLCSFLHIFFLSCILHLACIFELPQWGEQSLKKWSVICGCTNFFWPLLNTLRPWLSPVALPDNQHQCSNIPESQLLGLQNCSSIALKQLWNGFLVFIASKDSLVTR